MRIKESNQYARILVLLAILIVIATAVLAHEETESGATNEVKFNLDEPVSYILVTSGWVLLISITLLFAPVFAARHKKTLFLMIAIPVILSTLFLAGNTLYKNFHSVTRGPVHWHADYQVWACGKQLDLVNPKGLSNKIGSNLMHEHNDDRMHIEGVLDKREDVNLGNYFMNIGGMLKNDAISYPTVKGAVHYKNGDTCPDGSIGTLKVYVNGKRITEPVSYVISPQENVPPGDCIIYLFDNSNADATDKVCESWTAKDWTYEKQGGT